jgi:DNA-binding transcriptional LysR family regulator
LTELDLMGLRTFVAICEKGSVTDAARYLGMTQSAVSQRLKKLEDGCKFQLLDRQIRPIGPTSAGQLLLDRARRVLAEIDKLEFALSHESDLPIWELRLGVSDSLGGTLVPPLVRAIRETVHRLTVRVDNSTELGRRLLHRDLHAIVSSDHLPDREDLERHEIHREPLVIAVSNSVEFPVHDARAILDQLTKTLPFIRYTAGTLLALQIEVLLRRLSLEPPLDLEFNDSDAITEMVRQGLGWTITTPICLQQSRAPLDDLSVIPLPFGGTRRGFYFISRRDELGTLTPRLAKISKDILSAAPKLKLMQNLAGNYPYPSDIDADYSIEN